MACPCKNVGQMTSFKTEYLPDLFQVSVEYGLFLGKKLRVMLMELLAHHDRIKLGSRLNRAACHHGVPQVRSRLPRFCFDNT